MPRTKKYFRSSIVWTEKALALLQRYGYLEVNGKAREGINLSNLVSKAIIKDLEVRGSKITNKQITQRILINKMLEFQRVRDKAQEDIQYFAEKLKKINFDLKQKKIKHFKK